MIYGCRPVLLSRNSGDHRDTNLMRDNPFVIFSNEATSSIFFNLPTTNEVEPFATGSRPIFQFAIWIHLYPLGSTYGFYPQTHGPAGLKLLTYVKVTKGPFSVSAKTQTKKKGHSLSHAP